MGGKNLTKEIKVDGLTEKIRLDSYISEKNEELSRSMIQKLIEEGKILVNEKEEKASYKVKDGDNIKIIIEPPKEVKIEAQEIPLDILYEDNDILVINKEKGMVVHPRKW